MKILQNLTNGEIIDYISVDTNLKQDLWLRITSLDEPSFLLTVGEYFGIHKLLIEDISNPGHQSKFEQYEEYSIIIIKIINEIDDEINTLQFSMIFGTNFLITFGEHSSPQITSYINSIKGKQSIDRTVYDLLDQIVDNYIAYAYKYQNKTDEIEDAILEHIGSHQLSSLFEFKQEMHQFKKIIRPVREITDSLLRSKPDIFSPSMKPYLKDLLDHANRVSAIAENIEETLNNLHGIILTQIQYKLNKTIAVLTAISVIFLPLMVITGIYGMNFEHMPELKYKYAYPIVLCIMATLGITMFTIFIRRKII